MSKADVHENDNSTVKKTRQFKTTLESLTNELELVRLPSPLWKVCVDLNGKSLTFSMAKVRDSVLRTTKSVVLTQTELGLIEVDMLMNDVSVNIPHICRNVCNVHELNNLLEDFDTVEFCKYYWDHNKENRCSIFNLPFMNVCSRCFQSTSDTVSRSDRRLCGTEKWVQVHANNQNNNRAMLCDITFNNKSSKSDTANTQCSLCGHIFHQQTQLLAHEKIHLPTNDGGKFQCTVCFRIFDRVTVIIEHYKEYHSNVKFLKCTICHHKYSNLQQLRKHVRFHTRYEAFVCNECTRSFANNKKLKKHSCKKHSQRQNKLGYHICSTCKVRYATKHLLQQHQREHVAHISLTCRTCNKKFDNRNQAAVHKTNCKTKHLKHFCDICSKKFSCISQKVFHMKKIHRLHM